MDLRFPSGLFFTILGLILIVVGVIWPDWRAPLTEANVNLHNGIVMLVFGGVLLTLAARARQRPR